MSSAICFNLDPSKILSSGIGLKKLFTDFDLIKKTLVAMAAEWNFLRDCLEISTGTAGHEDILKNSSSETSGQILK